MAWPTGRCPPDAKGAAVSDHKQTAVCAQEDGPPGWQTYMPMEERLGRTTNRRMRVAGRRVVVLGLRRATRLEQSRRRRRRVARFQAVRERTG